MKRAKEAPPDGRDIDELWMAAYTAAVGSTYLPSPMPSEACALYADKFVSEFTSRVRTEDFHTEWEGLYWVDIFEASANRRSFQESINMADEGLGLLRSRGHAEYARSQMPQPSGVSVAVDEDEPKNMGAKILKLVREKEQRET